MSSVYILGRHLGKPQCSTIAGSELYECPYYVEAKRLYFHIHARFIVTNAGTARMVRVSLRVFAYYPACDF